MAAKPSTNGANGQRDTRGRFTKGNAGGPGNPHARRVAQLRSFLLAAVSEDDLREIVAALVRQAKEGDITAAREILDRLVGKPTRGVDPVQSEFEKKEQRLRERSVAVAERHAQIAAWRI